MNFKKGKFETDVNIYHRKKLMEYRRSLSFSNVRYIIIIKYLLYFYLVKYVTICYRDKGKKNCVIIFFKKIKIHRLRRRPRIRINRLPDYINSNICQPKADSVHECS